YSYDASVKAPAPAAPAPPAPKVRIQWRIVPQNMRSAVLDRPDAKGAPAGENRSVHPMFIPAAMVSNQAVRTKAPAPAQIPAKRNMATNVVSSAAASAQISPVRTTNLFRLAGLASVAHLATQTQSQPVETPKFTMSFDYCLVRLRRPWFSGDLLARVG